MAVNFAKLPDLVGVKVASIAARRTQCVAGLASEESARRPPPQPVEQPYLIELEGTAELGFCPDFNVDLMSRPIRWWS